MSKAVDTDPFGSNGIAHLINDLIPCSDISKQTNAVKTLKSILWTKTRWLEQHDELHLIIYDKIIEWKVRNFFAWIQYSAIKSLILIYRHQEPANRHAMCRRPVLQMLLGASSIKPCRQYVSLYRHEMSNVCHFWWHFAKQIIRNQQYYSNLRLMGIGIAISEKKK